MNHHPEFYMTANEFTKWRYAYEGGRDFIELYLEKFSIRESDADFTSRKNITYCPRFAGAGIDDVKNSIYQRIADVTRVGGTQSYSEAIQGIYGGVDLNGNSMNSFIGCEVLLELTIMGRVGVYVDMPPLASRTLLHNSRPYLYTYKREDIVNWVKDPTDPTRYTNLLLRDYVYETDEDTGFPTEVIERYRRLWIEDNQVYVQLDDDAPLALNLQRIPFVCVELSDSLMKNIADYQIALLNLASSDLFYALKSNFPFYTEQFDPASLASEMLRPDGETSSVKEVIVGASSGRAYPIGADRPAFIAPPSDPLKASMEKQDQLKAEIRQLLNLNISNLRPIRESADSKAINDRSLEAGLSYIGLTIETAERAIAEVWAAYENSDAVATIKYPKEYTLKSDSERRDEASELNTIRLQIPSRTFQKSVSKQIVHLLLSNRVSREELEIIDSEIDKAPCVTGDPKSIRDDVEAGILDAELASQLRLYPPGTAKKAKDEHTERLIRIKNSQSSGARGTDTEQLSGRVEKELSRDNTLDPQATSNVRGEGK